MKYVSGFPTNPLPGGERQAVTEHHPERRHECHENQAVHHRGEDVLAAHQPAVKQNQSWRRHHQHQRGTHQHPRIIAVVDG